MTRWWWIALLIAAGIAAGLVAVPPAAGSVSGAESDCQTTTCGADDGPIEAQWQFIAGDVSSFARSLQA